MAFWNIQRGRAIRRKLRSNRGETIGETLVALLISALALVMLAGAISSTANMINTSDRKMGEYYSKDAALVEHSGTSTLTVTLTGTGVSEIRSVEYDLNDAFNTKPVVAYKVAPTT